MFIHTEKSTQRKFHTKSQMQFFNLTPEIAFPGSIKLHISWYKLCQFQRSLTNHFGKNINGPLAWKTQLSFWFKKVRPWLLNLVMTFQVGSCRRNGSSFGRNRTWASDSPFPMMTKPLCFSLFNSNVSMSKCRSPHTDVQHSAGKHSRFSSI